MGMPNQVDRWARLSLLAALGLALFGKLLDATGTSRFWGGLVFAFGDATMVGPLLAALAGRAREQRWLQPLLHEWVQRLQHWADSAQSRESILLRLQQVAGAYRQHGWFKKLTYQVAEFFGGVDLNHLAT